MEVSVKSKYLRISPRKLRPVINFVRGMNVVEARAKLQFQPNKGAKMIISLLDNAVSVVKTSEISSETFHIAAIACGDGPRLKRGTPVSKGRMAPIVKRQSHMTLTISDSPKIVKAKSTKIVKENKETKEPNGTKS